MATNRIGSSNQAQLHVAETVTRKTARPTDNGFGSVLRTGAGMALRGVEIGASVIGGPILGAAVRGVSGGIGGVGGGAGVVGGVVGGVSGGVSGSVSGGGGGPLGDAVVGGATNEQSTMDEVRALQEQGQEFNLQYLSLQEGVQQENRRFTTVSNVLKAKHETAKSAIGNIRS